MQEEKQGTSESPEVRTVRWDKGSFEKQHHLSFPPLGSHHYTKDPEVYLLVFLSKLRWEKPCLLQSSQEGPSQTEWQGIGLNKESPDFRASLPPGFLQPQRWLLLSLWCVSHFPGGPRALSLVTPSSFFFASQYTQTT